jgi:tetratricopeptide (TPR) repeat protein
MTTDLQGAQTLSLAMIVRDEEALLPRLLQSARTFCDQMVVVDTGSSDRTVEIARAAGAQVEHFAWIDDFGAARNYAFSLCTGDWIIWLDADDSLSEQSQRILFEWKSTFLASTDKDMICLPYVNQAARTMRERLVRRSANFRWHYPIHEVIPVPSKGALMLSDVEVMHAPSASLAGRKEGRNLRILEKWSRTSNEGYMLFYYGLELLDNQRFDEAVEAIKRFLAQERGDDKHGARYWSTVRLADALKILGRFQEGIEYCGNAITLAPSRGEAYTMMGLILVDQRRWEAAFAAFAAAACLVPPNVFGITLPAFYDPVPQEQMCRCLRELGHPAGLQQRLKTFSGLSVETFS